MKALIHGRFLSCEEENRTFSVLVEDRGKILFTGEELPPEYASIPKVDMAGRCVVPAFADTHMHFESYALFHSTVDVRDAADFEEMGGLLRRYIDAHPDVKFLPAYGCSAHTVAEGRLPERADLDRMTQVPLLIVKYDGHAAVANSALIAQFPAEVTGDPGFQADTGWLYQNAFYRGVNFITAQVPVLSVLGSMAAAADQLARQGLGLIHSVEGVGYKNDIDVDSLRMVRYGLPEAFRIYFQTMDVEKVTRRKMTGIGGCFSLALDGCFGSEDAALKEGYAHDPENHGFLAYTQEEVTDFCKRANRAGLQITMHAIGDAAVEQAVTAYEAALADFPRKDHRHIIIHGDLFPPELQKRAAALGLCVAVQPAFLDWRQEPGSYLEHILGKERAASMLPLRDLIDAGLLVSAGSDAPCTLPDPIQSIHNCCNHPDPAQSVTVEEALKMHTLWAARTSFDEEKRGSLRPGLAADFAVLDRDPLETPVTQLKEIRVLETWYAGKKYQGMGQSAASLLLAAVKGRMGDRTLK